MTRIVGRISVVKCDLLAPANDDEDDYDDEEDDYHDGKRRMSSMISLCDQ